MAHSNLQIPNPLGDTGQYVEDHDGRKSSLSLTEEGSVGIGTEAPSHIFHVVAFDAVGLFESTGTQAFLRFSTEEGLDNRVEIANRPGGRLALWTAGAGDVFNITKAGNVGIGTTDPKIHLAIGDADTGLQQQGDGELAIYTNNEERVRLAKSGNVGIGTTTPGAKLEVIGTVKATGLDITGPLSFKGANMTITGLPDASTAPHGADLESVVVDKNTGKLYMQ